MKYVIVAISHGVEDREIPDDYAQPLIDNIRSYLSEEEKAYFLTSPINYSKRTQYRQMQMFRFCDEGLGKQKLRQMKYTMGGDLIMYQRTKAGVGFLADLHKQIDSAISFKLKQAEDPTILLLGHSLGSVIMYNHLFETQLITKPKGIFIMGSPFALYSLPYENWGGLPQHYIIDFMWNFYNPEDWISSQIQDRHPCEEIAYFCKDFRIQPSFFSLSRWTQKTMLYGGLNAHGCYWHNKQVAKQIAEKLKTYINRL